MDETQTTDKWTVKDAVTIPVALIAALVVWLLPIWMFSKLWGKVLEFVLKSKPETE